MIVRFLSQARSSAGTADYMIAEHHDAVVLSTTLTAEFGEPIPRRSEATAAHMHDLTDYMDDMAKTMVVGRTISAEARAEMEARDALRPDVENTWIHLVISYGLQDRDKVDDRLMASDVDSLVKHLVRADNDWKARRAEQRGCRLPEPTDPDGMLYVAAVHREKAHLHVHVLMNRIDEHGNLYAGYQQRYRGREWAVEREQEHGFVRTRMSVLDRDDDGHALSPAEVAKREIQEVADQSTDRDDLAARLAERGLHLEEGRRGWIIRDDAGTTMPASRAGLVGHRAPHRIGGGTPADVAKAELWEAAARSPDFETFKGLIAKNGLMVETDRRGTVTEVYRVDVEGHRMDGRTWTPQDLGFRHPPSAHHWKRPQTRKTATERDAERPSTRSRPEPERSADRKREPILLVPPADDRAAGLTAILRERDGIVAKRAAARSAEMAASKARVEARRAQQAQQAQEQQRVARETLLAQQQQEALQRRVRDALADDRDRSDAVPGRTSPSADAPRQEPTSTPSVDAAVPDAVPDEPPSKPFRMER